MLVASQSSSNQQTELLLEGPAVLCQAKELFLGSLQTPSGGSTPSAVVVSPSAVAVSPSADAVLRNASAGCLPPGADDVSAGLAALIGVDGFAHVLFSW